MDFCVVHSGISYVFFLCLLFSLRFSSFVQSKVVRKSRMRTEWLCGGGKERIARRQRRWINNEYREEAEEKKTSERKTGCRKHKKGESSISYEYENREISNIFRLGWTPRSFFFFPSLYIFSRKVYTNKMKIHRCVIFFYNPCRNHSPSHSVRVFFCCVHSFPLRSASRFRRTFLCQSKERSLHVVCDHSVNATAQQHYRTHMHMVERWIFFSRCVLGAHLAATTAAMRCYIVYLFKLKLKKVKHLLDTKWSG